MSRILLAGDSWACGEWGRGADLTYRWSTNGIRYRTDELYGVVHLGLEEYLSEHHTVLNTASPGASNTFSIERLMIDIHSFNPDFTIWIQTDPIRDLRRNRYESLCAHEVITKDQLTDIQHDLIAGSYLTLNSIGVPIICMGGTSKLNIELIKKYHKLTPAIKSMIEFINPDLIAPDIWISEWIQEELSFDEGCMTLLEKNKGLMSKMCGDSSFSQCGHPLRQGLRKVYEYINETQL
jgi:hypothetical protein